MKKRIPVVIQDSKDVRNIFIQVNLKKGSTSILSNFSAWENLSLIMEGLALAAEKCIQEEIPKKKVYRAITDYLMKVLPSYKIKNKN